MMEPSWEEHLKGVLASSRRLAVVGVGQELRGDDAAGVILVRRLCEDRSDPAETQSPPDSPLYPAPTLSDTEPPAARWYFEAGSLPEASAGPLRRFRPDWVLFLDAAELGEPPGCVRWIDPVQLEGDSPGTHTFPMSGFSAYLESELGCHVAILGIQSKQMEFDTPVSEEVRSAIDRIARIFGTPA
jgi:hydrogenase 3 maturation protease